MTEERRDFCSYFDHRYFDRGVALYHSLMAHCPAARLWVLCLSDECHRALSVLQLPNMLLIRLGEFEACNPALAIARANRSLIEYYFTCTPSFMDWIFKRDASVSMLTYLDSDLFFFSNPEPIFEAFEGYSTLIIPHRFPPRVANRIRYGKYNVGWVSFRNDADGLACLAWWRDRCLEWCYDRLQGDRFADQKYLDRFEEMFQGVLALNHPGANLAPWNLGAHRLEVLEGRLLVDSAPLLFFHFHDFRQLLPHLWDTRNRFHFAPPGRVLSGLLYRPYCRALYRARALGRQATLCREPTLVRNHSLIGKIRQVRNAIAKKDAVISLY